MDDDVMIIEYGDTYAVTQQREFAAYLAKHLALFAISFDVATKFNGGVVTEWRFNYPEDVYQIVVGIETQFCAK